MRKIKHVYIFSVIVFCMLLAFCGCDSHTPVIEEEIFALDTVINMTVYSDNKKAVSSAKAEIRRLEAMFSVTDNESDVSRINSSSESFVEVSDECFSLINTALDVSEKTGGNFDITVYPAVKLWGFTTNEKHVPDMDELNEVKEFIDYKQVAVNQNSKSVKLPMGASIDLGAIAKGYISDRASEVLKENGVTSAILNLGGNIRLVGTKPNGENYKIGVKSPSEDGYFGILTAKDTNISTAGGYERFFESDGKRYHHIIDPDTASPAQTDVLSATVIGEKGEICDALSTSAVVMGIKALKDLSECYPDYSFIILTENSVYASEKIADSFKLTENYENYKINII